MLNYLNLIETMLRRVESLYTYILDFQCVKSNILSGIIPVALPYYHFAFMVIVYLGYSTRASEAPLKMRADRLKILQYKTPRLLENTLLLQPIEPL